MEMYIWKWSDAISIYHKKIWKSADIHIKGTKHMPFCYHYGIVYALSGGEKGSCFAEDAD